MKSEKQIKEIGVELIKALKKINKSQTDLIKMEFSVSFYFAMKFKDLKETKKMNE